MRGRLMLAACLLPVMFAACGDDEETADEPTHDEWFDAICAKVGSADPGFEQFFADHPEPTLAEWAEFLPAVVDTMDSMVDALESTPAPADEADAIAGAAAAISVVRDNFAASQAAAEAGDQATFDELEEKNQSVDVPAMEAAMVGTDDRECPSSES